MDASKLVAEIVQRDLSPVHADTPLQSVTGWDSLKMVHLVVRLEELLDRELLEEELEGLQTIGHVEKLLAAG